MPREDGSRYNGRRKVLKGLAIGGIAGLAGCGGGGDDTPTSGGDTPTESDGDSDRSTPTPTRTPTPTVEQTATPETIGDTLVGPDGEQVTLQLVYSTGSETTETQMQLIQQLYGEVGINVELNGVQFNAMLDQYAANKTEDMSQDEATFNAGGRDEATSQEEWDLMGGIGFNSYPRSPTTIQTFWSDVDKPVAATNFYGYKPSANIEELLSEAGSSTDPEVTQNNLAEVFGVLSRDQPTNFLTISTNLLGFRSNVAGLGDFGPSFGFDYQRRYFDDGGGGPAVGGNYIEGDATGAQTLNPLRISDVPSNARVSLTMDGAYSLNNENEFAGRWFEDYDVKDGQQTYEFFLRDNLQWGEDFGQMTADDWIYYIQEVRQAPDNWSGDTNHGDWFRNDEPIPVEKTGDLSFEVQLSEPDPFFIQRPILWGAYCLPEGLVSEYRDAENGGEQLTQDERINTLSYTGNLGPYSFDRWDRNSVFVATRNEDYYGAGTIFEEDAPYFEQNQIQVFGEESTRLSALRTGEITATGLPSDSVGEYEENEDINVVRVPEAFTGMLVYNQRANGWEELRKVEVRQALSRAVDKVSIVENILRGNANVAYTHQPRWSDWYIDDQITEFGGPDSHSIGGAQRQLQDALSDGYEFQ